jgi:hypothetical protein
VLAHGFAAEAPKPAEAKPAPNSSASCLECHSDETLSMKKGGKKLAAVRRRKNRRQVRAPLARVHRLP